MPSTTITTTKKRRVVPVSGYDATPEDWADLYQEAWEAEDLNQPEFYVDDYLTENGNDHKLAFSAAVAAAKALGRAATVVLGAALYDVRDYFVECPEHNDKRLTIRGQGYPTTILHFSVDRGLGTVAIEPASFPTFWVCSATFKDMLILGPGGLAAVTPGASPANMDGVRLIHGMRLENVRVTGFRSGIILSGDHVVAKDCEFSYNYDAMRVDDQVTYGDNDFYSCLFMHNGRAGISLANDAQLITTSFFSGHIGWQPYAFYVDAGGATDFASFNQVDLWGVGMESLGNGFFYAAGKTANLANVILVHCNDWTSNATYKISGSDPFVGVYAYRNPNWQIHGFGPYPFDVTNLGPLMWFSYYWKTYYDYWQADTGTRAPLFKCAAIGLGGVILMDGANRHEVFCALPSNAVTKGQIVGLSGADLPARVKPYARDAAVGGQVLAGVARNDGSHETSVPIICAVRDLDGLVEVLVDGTGFAAGAMLVPHETTAGKVTRSAASNSKAIGKALVGRAMGVESGGKVTAAVYVSPAAEHVRPTVAAAPTSAIGGAAGASYTAAEQTLLNQLRTAVLELQTGQASQRTALIDSGVAQA